MARLENQANFGYVPLNSDVARIIPTYLGLAPDLSERELQQVRIFDPCIGEGGALAAIAETLGIPRAQRYGCDIHAGRVEQAQAVADHVLHADALKSLVASERAFAVAYGNPPFDNDGREEGGGRLEVKFFERCIREGRWVQVGGVVVWVTPQDIFARPAFCQALAACLDDVSAYALPDDVRHFREAVVFGVVRRRERRGDERDAEQARLAALFAGSLPLLTAQAEPRYVLPTPEDRKVVWKLAASGSGREALADIAVTGGAWGSEAYVRLTQDAAPVMRPLMPMKRAYIGFAIGRGRIDGITVPIHGVPHMVKGGTMEQVITQTEERAGEGSVSTIERTIRQEVACITGVSLTDGAVRQFVGAEGLTALMADSDAARAITDAAIAAMPPFYQFDMEPWLARYLASITPPVALPGYAPGIIPMQQHLIAAGIRGLNAHDAAWRRVRRSHVYSATMGTGKALAVDAKLLTPDGWIRMGDVQLGDQVIGRDGHPHSVVGVFPQGERDIYRVTFSDGSSVECTDDHLWYVENTDDRYWKRQGRVLALKEFMHDLTTRQGNNRWYIPMVEPVEFPQRELPLDPYLLGVLIGDGSLEMRTTSLSSADAELRDHISSLLPGNVKLVPDGGYDYRLSGGKKKHANPVTVALRGLGLAGKRSQEKYIPHDYLFSARADRVALLQGLLDTDGSADTRGHIEFSTSSQQLAQDVVALVQSLGGRARIVGRDTFYTYRGQKRQGRLSYRMTITLPRSIHPFRLSRKAKRYTFRPKYPPSRAIVTVELVGRKEAQCIAVDAPDHLYVTDHFIVTHNTALTTLTADAQVQLLTGEWRRWEGAADWGDGSLTADGVRRAPVVIVSAPGHLIGTQAQVDAFFRDGSGGLPQWYSEWRNLLGDRYRMQILETPADVGVFFRGALADPTTPRVGFIADTVMKLDSGYDLGAERLRDSRFQQRRAAIFSDDDELERKDYERLRKRRRQQAQAEAQASENAGDASILDWTQAIAAAETPEEAARLRRLQRDYDHYGLGQATWEPLTDAHGQAHTHSDGTPIMHMRRRGRRRLIRNGLCCTHCGRMARTAKGDPIAAHTLKNSGLAKIRCEWCDEKLGCRSREQDSVKDRDQAVFSDPAWRERTMTEQRLRPVTLLPDGTVLTRPRSPLPAGATVEWVTDERPSIPWGRIPTSNPRYALAKLIRRRWKGFVDVYVADEFHECAGRSTAIGAAFGALCAASRFRVAGSGTGMNGYAASLYYPLLRLGCVPVQDRYGWDDEQRFVEECGILMEIRHTSQRVTKAGHFSGEPQVDVSIRQMPGMTALLGELFCNVASIVDLPDMGFHLPDYSEDAVVLPMHPEVKANYHGLESGGREVIAWGGHDALSAYLQATLSYPYQPWTPKTIYSELKASRGSTSFAGPVTSTVLPEDIILPHHEWLAEFAATEVLAGRRVLVGIEHTGVDDICEDVAQKVARLARARFGVTLKVATLRSTVARGERGLWFKECEREGVNIVLCHPKLVKTGLNLIQWPSIVVLEPNYSLEVVAQFIRRSFRPTQTQPVKVRFVCYEGTMSERAIELVAQKMGTLAMLNGNEFMTGISSIGEGMSILQQLAQSVTAEQPSERVDLRQAFQASAQGYKEAMEVGAAGFLGVDASRVVQLTRQDVVVAPEAAVTVANVPAAVPSARPGVPAFGQTLADAVRRRKAARQQVADVGQADMFAVFGASPAAEPSSVAHEPIVLPVVPSTQQAALW